VPITSPLHVGESRPYQATVLDERAGIGERRDTLARGPPPPLFLPRDGIRPRGVLEGGPRLPHLFDGDAWQVGLFLAGHHSALMFAARMTSR
jgi:hypothetical protein